MKNSEDQLRAVLAEAFESLLQDAASAALRRVHDPDVGDQVLPHLVVKLENEVPVEDGLVFRYYSLANGRTGGQKCQPGTAQQDFRFPITVVD
jgi:hypothetical protein